MLITFIIFSILSLIYGLCQFSHKWLKFRFWFLSEDQLKKQYKPGKYIALFWFAMALAFLIIGLYKHFTGGF